ncbi:putative alcohol dehydrogenase [Colletotrichum kahawae]|uniref:Alcohol dehydrogenase n=1 Tax=Colletotrichum kahawae TaxID=34407 RepID=A0AAD9Y5Z8_COLKA|nr:putative alcohol dehydrogenase [Colletotrichum kahawae]
MSFPATTQAWKVTDIRSDDFEGLQLVDDVPVSALGDHDVLVQIEAVSLNYRDLAIPRVTDFTAGDKVYTLFNELHQTNPITPDAVGSGLGGAVDGTLRKYAVFPDHGLVTAPSTLSSIEASTLTCAALTAWNALFGLKKLKAGDWVLTQGNGGVSLAAIQFAVATGATVVATTSSNDKADILKKMGVSHVINYREVAEWGDAARALTPKGLGFDHILEIGGAATVAQSLKAIKLEGIITIIGFLTSNEMTSSRI